MTLQEIKERIAAYESKYGKLGHTNIMKPEKEIQHSALNERRNTMIKTTNDFYKFRQKVAIGKEANKLAHKATISPEELNERNFQNQIDNNTLIHAGKNFKYVAKEEVDGKPRYFYTQEEYDAFKNNGKTAGNAGDMAGRLMKSAANDVFKPENDRSKSVERIRQEEEAIKEREKYNNIVKNHMAEKANKIAKIAREGSPEAAAAQFVKEDNTTKDLMKLFETLIDNGAMDMNKNGEITLYPGYESYQEEIESLSNDMQTLLNQVSKSTSQDEARKIKKEVERLIVDRCRKLLSGEEETQGSDVLKADPDDKVKHSAFDEEDEAPSYKTAADLRQEREESIMSEYRAFKARANKGAEKNRLSHSAVISPRDLNAKYEEELMKEYIAIHPENDDDIEHSSNGRAYYNKIDKYYPDGTARYFYSQAEWEAYQEGLKRSQYEANKKAQESEKKISDYNAKKEADSRNNMGGYADYKKAQSAKAEADSRNNMSGYADYKKAQSAKSEADSRNNMGGYKNWKEDQENEAKKLDAQKAEASRRSGMDDYEEYQKEQKEEEYKTRAKQKAGMEGYAAYNKAKEAKNEADSRNDMSGYNQWKEESAKAKKEADQKSEAAKRSGMEGYEQYQQDKKTEAQKADMAKRQGMEGREEWDKEQKAEKEANAKKVAEDRNDMGGYAAWKRRRDYINNQKKASEAADAAEAEKHEIERKAVKNSTEVTKNKAAAKAQEAAEAEKHEAESDKRIAEERAGASKRYDDAKNAAINAGHESARQLHNENEARDKEHEADKAKRINREKIDNLHNNANKIIHDTAKKYDQQIDAYNAVFEKMKDKTSPEAKEIKDKIEKAYIEKDTALAREIETIIEDIGEAYNGLSDKNSPEAQALKGEAYSILLRNDAGFRTTETAKKKLAGAKTKYDTIFR